MATCDMGYEHGTEPAEPSQPEVILTQPETNEHDVAIAEARADAQVAETKAFAAAKDPEKDAEIARLQGEIDGMREAIAQLQPAPPAEPEPAVVVAEVGEPAPPEDTPAVPPEPKGDRKRPKMWDAYRK